MKAVATVSSFPSATYTANETVDTSTGASDHRAWNMTEFRRATSIQQSVFATFYPYQYAPLISHFNSFSLASNALPIHLSSHAKNLINFTAPMSSFNTPILLSLAAITPF